MKRFIPLIIVVAISLSLVQCGVISNTIDDGVKPRPYPPGVTKEILDLHRSLVRLQQTASVEEPFCYFQLSWTHIFLTDSIINPSDSINGYILERSDGLDNPFYVLAVIPDPHDTTYTDSTMAQEIRYCYVARAYKIGPGGDTTYTEAEIAIKLMPDNPPYHSNNWRDIMYSACSDTVSGMWTAMGDQVEWRENIAFYDSIWTSCDILVVNTPRYNPHEIEWIRTAESEKVIWKGYDPNQDGYHNLSDLVYYGNAVYNRRAIDSTEVSH